MNHHLTTVRGAMVSWRPAIAAALLALLTTLILLPRLAGTDSGAPEAGPAATAHEAAPLLPVAAFGPVSQALGESSSAYRASADAGGLRAANPAQHLRIRFRPAGLVLGTAGSRLMLGAGALGYGETSTAIAPVTPQAHANRVVYQHPGLAEWYVNGPLGVEQGFTIPRPPAGDPAKPLTLSLALSGAGARAALAPGAGAVLLTARGGLSLRFGELHASDASGRSLRSWLAVHDGRVLLRVDAKEARFPLTIDPFVQEGGRVTGSGEAGAGELGFSVAISQDGSTALVGAPRDNSSSGAVWVFVRSRGTWRQQAKLTANEATQAKECGEIGEETEECGFGKSVALSADGNTALVGGPRQAGPCWKGECPAQGAAWVFTRVMVNEGGTEEARWTLQSKLTGGEEETAEGRFGHSVALSADGNTALIGASSDGGGRGAAWVWTRSQSTWAQQGPKLTGEEEGGTGHLGGSVALSADGRAALVGGPGDKGYIGAAWYFTRPAATWGQKGSKLTAGGDEQGTGHFGSSVALSADGTTALVGARADGGRLGAVWPFTRSEEGKLVHQGERLTAPEDAIGKGEFGFSLALSSDGATALIGAPRDSNAVGAAWLFERSASTWSADGSKLTGMGFSEGVAPKGLFGGSVAVRGDGVAALIGAPSDSGKAGAVWMFAQPSTLPAVSGIAPNAGPPGGGTSVTISGMRLSSATSVNFGATSAASFTVNPNGSITAISPPGPGGATDTTVHVSVTTSEGTSPVGPADQFTYMQPPTVSAVSPSLGPAAGGTTVTITGTHLGPATAVSFGSVAASSFKVNSQTSITAIAPAEPAATVHVVVGSPGGSSSETARDRFTFLAPEGPPGIPPGGSPGGFPAGSAASLAASGSGGAAAGVLGFGPACSAVLASRNVAVLSRGRAAVKLIWRGAGTCRGRLQLSVRIKAGRRVKTRTIAAGTFAVLGGRVRTITIRLNTLGRSRLGAGHGKLSANLAIVNLTPAAVARSANVRLTLQSARKTKTRGR